MPLGTFICRDFSVLLVRPTEAPRMSSTDEGGAQKHRRRKRLHAPSVRMFPGTLMGAKVRDGYGPMSPSATAIGPSGMGMGQRVVSIVKKRVPEVIFQALEGMARARERQIPKLDINCGSSSRSSDRSEKVCVGRLRARPPLHSGEVTPT